MHDPRECRQRALTFARRAQTSATPQARQTFANLAQTWLKLAADLERSEAQLKPEPNRRERLAS
jgi:hypothetical protein